MGGLSDLSYEELSQLEQQIKADRAPKARSLSDLSVDELKSLEQEVQSSKNGLNEKSLAKPSMSESLRIGAEKGITLGARPFVAGVGGGIGGFIGTLQGGGSFGQAVDTAKQYFNEERNAAQEEQRVSESTNPTAATVGELGGSILTLPFTAGRGVAGAVKLGALSGAGQALGEAKSLKEGVADVALGAGTGAATYGLAKGAGAVGSALANTKAGQALTGVANKVLALPKSAALKISHALTGISEKDIATYAAQTDKVDKLIKQSGGDLTGAADELRQNLSNKIQDVRRGLNAQISEALSEAPTAKAIDTRPILEALDQAESKINVGLHPEAKAQLDQIRTRIQTQLVDGRTDVKSLYEIGQFLQDRAKSAYVQDGQIFVNNNQAMQGAKNAARMARKLLNPMAPEIAEANNKLSLLHQLEDKLNSNLIKPGGPDSALFAAAKGANPRNAKMLTRLGEVTGTDPLGDAKVLSAARTFANAPLISMDQTGKAAGRMLLGAGAAKAAGADNETAALVAISTNPGVLKKAIQTGALGRKMATYLTQKATGSAVLNDAAISKTIDFLKTKEGKAVLATIEGPMQRRLRGQ